MTLKYIKKLCTPAYVYLVVSVIAIVLSMFQNSGNTDVYCMGAYECPVPNTALVFLIQFAYVAFWTFILDSVCKAGYKQFSWFLVLFPFLLFFVLLGLMMVSQGGGM
jgi:hypothetical protein